MITWLGCRGIFQGHKVILMWFLRLEPASKHSERERLKRENKQNCEIGKINGTDLRGNEQNNLLISSESFP